MRGFELDFESERINVLRALVEFVGHLHGKHSAVEQSVKRCLRNVVAARHARTSARLADQLPNRMQEVDVVIGKVVDPLECWQRW